MERDRRAAPRRPLDRLRRVLRVARRGPRDGAQARLRDRHQPGADRAGDGVRRGRVRRWLRDRRQPVEDVRCGRRRPALADGLADQRRLHPADDAVPRQPLQGAPERDAGRRRHRCDARAGHLRRAQALLPREPSRLGLLHGRGSGHPVLRDHPGHRHRRGPVAPAADRPLVADLRPRAQTQPDAQGPTTRPQRHDGSGGHPRASSSPASTGRSSSPTPTASAPPSRIWRDSMRRPRRW